MNRAFSFLCVALLGAWPAVAATPPPASPAPKASEISFVVRKTVPKVSEGPDVGRTYFAAGENRIAFGAPKGCHLSSDDGHLLLLLKDLDLDGEIHVDRSPFPTDFDILDNALKYRKAASQSMPDGAQEVVVQTPALDVYPFNGWKSLGFTWTYVSAGRAMVRTVTYLNLEIGKQIVITTLASKKDAEAVGKLATNFMASWWMMGN